MSAPGRVMSSEYIEWAKTRSFARFNLATSDVLHYSLKDLGVSLDDIELSGPSWYGYEPLQAALAAKCGVTPDCVVAAIGTSLANHLAMAAVIAPGDDVLIEQPAYDPVVALARYLGATVKRFPRRFADGFRVDPAEVERNVTPRTRLIVVTNLHNPSGALIGNSALQQVGEIARRIGAHVLVDEVYLEALFHELHSTASASTEKGPRPAQRSAFHLGPEFMVTSSLTKAYGLSGLRCGWILAQRELAKNMWRLNDLFGVIPAHAAERLSVIALERLPKIARRAKGLLDANRALLNRFLDSRSDLETFRPEFGTVVFPRWKRGNTEKLCAVLREKYETSVVPGRFFEMPDHFRVGIGGESDELAAGLERLGAALDGLSGR